MNKQSSLEQEARQAGFPATLFGFTPQDAAYWREPGLPWLTADLHAAMPPGYDGQPMQLTTCLVASGQAMGPRFPKGCVVQVTPVGARANLRVGRVYLYVYREGGTGHEHCQLGRLAHVGGNFLRVSADNYPVPALWLLRENEAEAVADVYEVTHYVSYPDLSC